MKRYEPAVEHGSPVMEPYSLGDWVRYEDAEAVVEALECLLEAAEAEGVEYMGWSGAVELTRAALKQINGE